MIDAKHRIISRLNLPQLYINEVSDSVLSDIWRRLQKINHQPRVNITLTLHAMQPVSNAYLIAYIHNTLYSKPGTLLSRNAEVNRQMILKSWEWNRLTKSVKQHPLYGSQTQQTRHRLHQLRACELPYQTTRRPRKINFYPETIKSCRTGAQVKTRSRLQYKAISIATKHHQFGLDEKHDNNSSTLRKFLQIRKHCSYTIPKFHTMWHNVRREERDIQIYSIIECRRL